MINFLKRVANVFYYLFLAFTNPKKAWVKLKNDNDQIFIGWGWYILNTIIFTPPVIIAAMFIKAQGWTHIFIKGVESTMVYQYLALTTPFVPFILLMACAGVFILLTEDFLVTNKEIFTVTMYYTNFITFIDILMETTTIIWFLISKSNVFTPTIIGIMYFIYGIEFLWGSLLLFFGCRTVFGMKLPRAIITTILGNLVYWFLTMIWIF